MIVEFPAPPFTRESLTSTFGFPVPLPFVAFLNALCQDCANGEAVRARVADVLEWDLADEDQRYQQTPPELFPIAGTGVDGGLWLLKNVFDVGNRRWPTVEYVFLSPGSTSGTSATGAK